MRTVLLIDDNQDFGEMIQEGLRKRGFEVHYRPSDDGAVDFVMSDGVDVVITDLEFEGAGGLALCDELRSRKASVPVIVLTGHIDASEAARRLGARAVLTKPVTIDLLDETIRAVSESDGA